MLVIKIELWPGGSEARKREIGRGTITNIGGTNQVGEYDVRLMKSWEYAKREGVWRRGRVSDFPRLRLGPWDLLLRALIGCVGDRSRRTVADLGAQDLRSAPMPEDMP